MSWLDFLPVAIGIAAGLGCFVLGWIGGWTARRKRWERTGQI